MFAMKKKEVLLIFKTHLDIGFTDYSQAVIEKYLNNYIPAAIKLGYELKDTDTPFIWSTGSWMIHKALKAGNKMVEQAIRDGIISWHGLPFTTHTELMNKDLFEYGLSLSAELDSRFEKKTKGAKLTDVPGHTLGMIEPMAKHGIEFLHIGVNPATPVPDVPKLFRWQHNGYSINVMYQFDYGEMMEFEDFVIGFGHTGDNNGPQSSKDIKKFYEEVRNMYPEAKVYAATLNDVAEKISHLKDLPIVTSEIGDTWIHGAATDPKKLGMYRSLLREIKSKGIKNDITDNLLLVPEHTWGMDIKTYFKHEDSYLNKEFKKLIGSKEYDTVTNSWQEQRNYVLDASKSLGYEINYPADFELPDNTELCELNNPDVEISWQLFDTSDYKRYFTTYNRCDLSWAVWDFTKVGLPDYKGGIYNAATKEVYKSGNKHFYFMEFDKDIKDEYGVGRIVVEKDGNHYTVRWLEKEASRLPQALWLKFKGMDENWEIEKLGEWISPDNILDSRLISAFDEGIRNKDVFIKGYDCALVAPYGRHLLEYKIKTEGQDLYFNLYNNIWNTNFPMWYSDDSVYRFEIQNR